MQRIPCHGESAGQLMECKGPWLECKIRTALVLSSWCVSLRKIIMNQHDVQMMLRNASLKWKETPAV